MRSKREIARRVALRMTERLHAIIRRAALVAIRQCQRGIPAEEAAEKAVRSVLGSARRIRVPKGGR